MVKCHGLAKIHGQNNVAHIVGQNFRKSPIFGVVGRNAFDFMFDNIGDFFADRQNLGAGIFSPKLGGVTYSYLLGMTQFSFDIFLLYSTYRCEKNVNSMLKFNVDYVIFKCYYIKGLDLSRKN